MICKVIQNISLGNGYFLLAIKSPEIAAKAMPGQFLMVKIADRTSDPLLRRPLSIMNVQENGNLEIMYKTAGRGTTILSMLKPDSELDMTGPLGTGFKYSNERISLLVGGGVGMPPLLYLAHYIISRKAGKIIVFMGARSGIDLPITGRFQKLGIEIFIATENGDMGVKGLVTKPLLEYLELNSEREGHVLYACGPDPMLKAIKQIGVQYELPAQLSLEEHMACGIGACLGCVVKTKSGYQRVCKDGPVFNADSLKKWD